jgi:ketosteroid isomerase-like protein
MGTFIVSFESGSLTLTDFGSVTEEGDMLMSLSGIKSLLVATLLLLAPNASAQSRIHPRGSYYRAMRTPNAWLSASILVQVGFPTELRHRTFESESGQKIEAQAEANEEVLKVNEECNAAELRGDVAAMDSCETDDFTHTHANGTVEHKAEYLKGVGSGAHKFLLLDLSEVHVRSYGTSAIVEGHIHLRANNNGKIADVNNLFMTVWVKQQGKWREAAWIADRLPKDAVPGSEGK